MKNIIRLSLSVVFLAMMASSCKKGQKNEDTNPFNARSQSTSTNPITDFFQAIRQDVAGEMSLTSFNTLATQSQPCNSTQFRGGYKRGASGRICVGPVTVTIMGKNFIVYKEMPCDQCYDPNQNLELFGQTIGLKADGTTFNGSTYAHDIYVPTKVNIVSPTFTEGQQIANGSSLTWNADAQNPKADVVYITYDPGSYENAEFATAYPNPISIGIPAGTSGTYTFSSGDFTDFPDGAHISVSVSRYNWEVFTNPDLQEDFLALAGSTVANTFILDK